MEKTTKDYGWGNRELYCVGHGYKEPNQHKWGPGCRDIYSLHYVLSGCGYVKVQNRTFCLKKGESFLIFPGEEYYYYPDEKDPWEYMWVDFQGKGCQRLLELTEFTTTHPIMKRGEEVYSYFQIATEEQDRILKEEQESARVHLLLTHFFRENLSRARENQKSYIELAREYIANYYWRCDLSVPDIATHLHIDRTYLYRLFKNELGISPLQYLTDVRMERAVTLLTESRMPVQSVAGSVGYEDALYFSKTFKKAKGASPSDYRNKVQLPLSLR